MWKTEINIIYLHVTCWEHIWILWKRSKRCGDKNWIGGWSVCELWINNIVILLIWTQKVYFSDDDAIYDVIIQEPVWKWRHDMKSAGIHLLNYFSLRQTQPFSFLDKWTGPILPFVVLPLYIISCKYCSVVYFLETSRTKPRKYTISPEGKSKTQKRLDA